MDRLGRPSSLRFRRKHWAQMLAEVEICAPEEACGLIGGKDGGALEVFPVENALHSSERYRLEARGQISVFLELDRHGWDLLAIYHSHPQGPETPSPTDIESAAYPEASHLIWSRLAGNWCCRAFHIENRGYFEIPIFLEEE